METSAYRLIIQKWEAMIHFYGYNSFKRRILLLLYMQNCNIFNRIVITTSNQKSTN